MVNGSGNGSHGIGGGVGGLMTPMVWSLCIYTRYSHGVEGARGNTDDTSDDALMSVHIRQVTHGVGGRGGGGGVMTLMMMLWCVCIYTRYHMVTVHFPLW